MSFPTPSILPVTPASEAQASSGDWVVPGFGVSARASVPTSGSNQLAIWQMGPRVRKPAMESSFDDEDIGLGRVESRNKGTAAMGAEGARVPDTKKGDDCGQMAQNFTVFKERA